MFLRAYVRTKDGKRHTYFSLVESRRTERGPRQRIVAQLGELSPDEQRRWQRTAIFHARHAEGRELSLFPAEALGANVVSTTEALHPGVGTRAEARAGESGQAVASDSRFGAAPADPGPDVVRVRLGKVGWKNARAFGDVWLGLQLWKKLGLDEIVARHIPQGQETAPPATMVAIEVISRLCVGNGGETSEFALAEHGYRRTALEDLLGVPDAVVNKDRLYRTLDALLEAKEPIERDLKQNLGELFSLNFDLLLCDLTSSFFEGLAEENDLAARGYSRDHRADCRQIVLAMIVTPDGFPLYHEVFAGNTNDAAAFPKIVEKMESRFGQARRVWVVDRGIASQANLDFLKQRKQSFLVGTLRSQLAEFEGELCTRHWQQIRESVEVKTVQREGRTYVLARSSQRRLKERAIRKRQLLGWHEDLKKLTARVENGRLKNADKAVEQIGRLRERWPAASKFAQVDVTRDDQGCATRVTWNYDRPRLRAALARDGAYLLLSDQVDWSPEQLWATYMQLTRAEEAFRSMKSNLLLRPMWHQLSGRIQAHVFVCVLAYALWKALDHMLRHAGLMTHIRKPDPQRKNATPKDRPMSPAVALRLLHDVQIGDILLTTVDDRILRLRRVARPNPEQAELLAGLRLTLPERLCADCDVTEPGQLGLPTEREPPKM
ncbi:MAG: IS1634 family transposase [Dongiaceae bacterium]